MLILLMNRLTASIGAAVSGFGRRRSRHAFDRMLMFDDHLLRDIGLTRNDVIEVLSSPSDDDPVDFLETRRKRNSSCADRPASEPAHRLAA
jgi:hypothetical protein